MWKEVLEVEKQSTFSIASLRSIPNDPKGKAMDALGGKVDHFTRYGSTQWDICTPETYQELIDVFHIDKMEGYKEYESLRQEYESLRFTHNLAPNHKNVWRSSQRNNGQLHPTQKPTDILSKIIKCSSNEGGTVLDPFMGSFSTAVACLSSHRHFIGFELDAEYYKWGNERITHYLKMRNIENIEDCFK